MKDPKKKKIEIEPIPHINPEEPIPPEYIPIPDREDPFPTIPEIIPLENPEITPVKD